MTGKAEKGTRLADVRPTIPPGHAVDLGLTHLPFIFAVLGEVETRRRDERIVAQSTMIDLLMVDRRQTAERLEKIEQELAEERVRSMRDAEEAREKSEATKREVMKVMEDLVRKSSPATEASVAVFGGTRPLKSGMMARVKMMEDIAGMMKAVGVDVKGETGGPVKGKKPSGKWDL